jgi:citrate lyase synthetase
MFSQTYQQLVSGKRFPSYRNQAKNRRKECQVGADIILFKQLLIVLMQPFGERLSTVQFF